MTIRMETKSHFQNIADISEVLIGHMKRRFGEDVYWTMKIFFWDDGTYRVTCQNGTNSGLRTIIRAYEWYKGEIIYEERLVGSTESYVTLRQIKCKTKKHESFQ